MTELFHTTDMGAHWSPLHFKKIQGRHDSYVSFTSDQSICCYDCSSAIQ